MIKRLYNIARSSLYNFLCKEIKDSKFNNEKRKFVNHQTDIYSDKLDSLSGYYANLELKPGASRGEVKEAWRSLLKKYHPDLHSADPKKRRIATELTGRLNEAYHILDKEFLKEG